mmetsp:Transcript_416/g.543  ORF Transcript_416/g.543 Transcript_416/m.543 type:complete len:285 (-) Transcript_416:242-1096(-)
MGGIRSSLAFTESLQINRSTIRPYIVTFDKLKCDVAEFEKSLPLLAQGGGRCAILLDRSLAEHPGILQRPSFWKVFEFLHLHKIVIRIELKPPESTSQREYEIEREPCHEHIVVMGNVFEFYYVYKIMKQLRQMLLAGAAPQPSERDYESKSHERFQVNAIESEEECPICMDQRQEIVVASCLHAYCAECYQEWKDASGTCPNCRLDLQNEVSNDFWQLEQWSQSDLKETIVSMKKSLMDSIRGQKVFSSYILQDYIEYDGSVDARITNSMHAEENSPPQHTSL